MVKYVIIIKTYKGVISMAIIFSPDKPKTINKVIEIPIQMVVPNPNQPRQFFDNDELRSLSDSIAHDGVLQPITVRKVGRVYEIVSGERRLKASRMAGLLTVPCIVVDITERSSALLALVENIQRSDLSFFDEAVAIDNLIDIYGMTQEDAALRLGMGQSTVANKLRLLKLSKEEKEAIIAGKLTERHARALLKITDSGERLAAIEKIIKNKLNVERTEQLIEQILQTESERENFRKRAVLLRDVRLFFNTVNKAVQTIKMAGVNAETKKTENEEFIEYYIKIPVSPAP